MGTTSLNCIQHTAKNMLSHKKNISDEALNSALRDKAGKSYGPLDDEIIISPNGTKMKLFDILGDIPASSKVLDIGTGDGKLVEGLRINDKDAYGLDPSKTTLPKKYYFKRMNLLEADYPFNFFDFIVSKNSVFTFTPFPIPMKERLVGLKKITSWLKINGKIRLIGVACPDKLKDFIARYIPELKVTQEGEVTRRRFPLQPPDYDPKERKYFNGVSYLELTKTKESKTTFKKSNNFYPTDFQNFALND